MDMNMFDEARSIAGMMSLCQASQSEMARRMGVSQSYVANKLRLLRLSDSIQRKIVESGLTERHARALLRIEEGQRTEALARMTERRMTVAEAEALSDLYRTESLPKRVKNATRVGHIATFLDSLRESVRTLTSIGVEASETVGHHGTRTYITISIDEK